MSAKDNRMHNEFCMADFKGNYYEVLDSSMHATSDELKSKYKDLIKQYHPDKFMQRTEKQPISLLDEAETDSIKDNDEITAEHLPPSISNDKFLLINRAWNVLKDPIKRKLYDAELLQKEFLEHSNIFARISLRDMQLYDVKTDNDTTHKAEFSELNSDIVSNSNFYTYKCRCGGQYILDETVALNHELLANSTILNTRKENEAVMDAKSDLNTLSDEEIFLECSECSLTVVISKEV